MNFFKNKIFIAVELLIAIIIATVLIRYYILVNKPDFFESKNRSYKVDYKKPSLIDRNKVPISILITDLGLDVEHLKWVIDNLSEEFLIGISPYMNPTVKDLVNSISNDVYVHLPIQSKDINEYNGELEIGSEDQEYNIDRINTVIEVVEKIKGLYIKNISYIADDKRTISYLLEKTYNHNLSILIGKNNIFDYHDIEKVGNKIDNIFTADVWFSDDENLESIQNILNQLEENHAQYKKIILFTLPSLPILNEIKNWLKRQQNFVLTREINHADFARIEPEF